MLYWACPGLSGFCWGSLPWSLLRVVAGAFIVFGNRYRVKFAVCVVVFPEMDAGGYCVVIYTFLCDSRLIFGYSIF